MNRLFLHNLGCSKNQMDGELLAGWAEIGGIQLVDDPSAADVIVINTCAFIQEAKEEAIDAILEAARFKERSTCRSLFVFGCLPQRYKETLARSLPEVDAFFGVGEWLDLLMAINPTQGQPNGNPFLRRHLSTPNHYAHLRIADGCNRGCAYCVIPAIRGPYRSRQPEEILEEAANLAARGVKELLPVAQELNSYGHDLGLGRGNKPLIRLLENLCKIDGLEWVRPLYLHPPACNEELLEFWASEPKLCRYLDLPVEHASDKVLKAMRRGGRKGDLRALFRTARRLMNDVILRTSVIVGFPGETEEDFEELLSFMREIRFERLGSFRFSVEEGTPAARLPGQIPEGVKAQRQETLMALQSEISHEISLERLGGIDEVFVDRYEEESGYSIAHSHKDLPELDGEILVQGRYPVGGKLQVRIESAAEYDLIANPITQAVAATSSPAVTMGEPS